MQSPGAFFRQSWGGASAQGGLAPAMLQLQDSAVTIGAPARAPGDAKHVSPGHFLQLSLGVLKAAPAPMAPPSGVPASLKRPRSGSLHPPTAGPYADIVARMCDARRLCQLTRNVEVALRDSGAGAAVAALSLEDEGKAVLALTRHLDMSTIRVSALSQYSKYCLSKGSDTILPITLVLALAFASNYVIAKQNKSHVLPTAISNLRVAAKANDAWNLSDEEEGVLARGIRALRKSLPSAKKVTLGMDVDQLMEVLTELAMCEDGPSTRLGAMIAAGVGFKMRGQELFGAKGIRRQDVEVREEGAIYQAKLVKVDQCVLAPRPRAAPHLPTEYSLLCTAWWIERYLAFVDPRQSMPDNNFLFCRLNSAGSWTPDPPDSATEQAAIFKYLEDKGMDLSGCNDEWGRHTGYDLHVHKCGMTYEAAGYLGDHAQNSVAKTHYVHSRGQDLLKTGFEHVRNFKRHMCCGE